jgi:hypothetical protein
MGYSIHYTILKRFMFKYDIDPVTKCWNWIGAKTDFGYAHFYYDGVSKAHRWVYQLMHGVLSPSMEIDHLCRNKSCVNPFHLEEVSRSTNIRRALEATRVTHCKWGHEFTEENTGI